VNETNNSVDLGGRRIIKKKKKLLKTEVEKELMTTVIVHE